MVWIIAILVALFVAGFCILQYACGRARREIDYWDEAVLEKQGYGDIKNLILSGRDWFLSQKREELECISYDGLRLHGIFIENENAQGTIMLFHGWHSSYKLDFMSSVEFYYSLGYNLIICEQRAHGGSEGRFLSYGVKESRDVENWVTYAAQLLGDEHPIYLGGISMGATTVLMAADRVLDGNVRGIIADCGFTSPYEIIEDVMKKMSRLIPVKPTMLLLGAFTRVFAGFGLKERSTVNTLAHSKYPVLLFHGTSDGFVPYDMTVRNYEACTSEKTMLLVPGARHGLSFIVEPEKYKAAIEKFTSENLT